MEGVRRYFNTERLCKWDTDTITQNIYDYTSGYPYLVLAICKIIDEELPEDKEIKNQAET